MREIGACLLLILDESGGTRHNCAEQERGRPWLCSVRADIGMIGWEREGLDDDAGRAEFTMLSEKVHAHACIRWVIEGYRRDTNWHWHVLVKDMGDEGTALSAYSHGR